MAKAPPPVPLSRRHGLSVGFTAFALSLLANPSRAAILEAEDDEELLERVKKDRRKRLQRQGVISSSDKETGSSFLTPPFAELASQIILLLLSNPVFVALFYDTFQTIETMEWRYLQELVYKLSKVGQAIENNDLSAASSVLGPSANADWVQNVNTAFTKLSSSPEEKIEVDSFNSSLASLFSSVGKHDIESSKLAFVSSATALEKWIGLTGLVGQLKGYLQELVYKLSKVGQAIENNDLSAASSVLGPRANADWVQNVNTAFTKLSSSPEEKIEVDSFNSSLASLFSSVGKHDIESSKLAFVSSATALEKWIGLTGLVGQLKGL
ncbi:putative Thylakoid lumenal 16.5 kDa protein, chloroplastic [Cocos nucifera]|nr:putative Thylakoid lumenal 16.5 kDa protein, chloroplastic [Cocos nucifera]